MYVVRTVQAKRNVFFKTEIENELTIKHTKDAKEFHDAFSKLNFYAVNKIIT